MIELQLIIAAISLAGKQLISLIYIILIYCHLKALYKSDNVAYIRGLHAVIVSCGYY